MERLKYIFLDSDISLAAFLMGVGLLFWGGFAIVMDPKAFFTFTSAMEIGPTWFWLGNYLVAGAGFVYVAYKEFPAGPSLFVAVHGGLVWTWIASVRGFSNVTSGVTLNILVIIMAFIVAQRSKVRK